MNRWTLSALAAGAIAVGVGLMAYRLTRAPDAPGHSIVAPASDASPLEVRAVAERMQQKRRIADEVIAGRTALLDAAAAFRRLDAGWPKSPADIRTVFPEAATPEEAYCRSVIQYARTESPRDEADDVARRLEDDLAARLRDGPLHLPEP